MLNNLYIDNYRLFICRQLQILIFYFDYIITLDLSLKFVFI